MKPKRLRGHELSDAEVLLLVRIEGGEHTFRPGSAPRPGEDFEGLVQHLRSLRDRGLIRLAQSRIMQREDGRLLAAGPCDLTVAGQEALNEDRRLGPRS